MDDGIGFPARSQSPGYDIGPDEDRPGYRPVQAILGFDAYSNGPQYSQVFVTQPSGPFFDEPIDEGVESEVISDTSKDDKKKFFHERERLKTYGKWTSAYSVNPVDLARNGFIHIGPRDRVLCVFCLKTITEWEEGDVVEKEHQRIYPNCPFVKGKCQDLNKPFSDIENLRQDFRVLQKGVDAKFPAFYDETLRLESFVNWPAHLNYCPKPSALAAAGFFYCPQQGKDDRVKCFMCGKVVFKWETGDNPWIEHARLSPHCKFVMQQKGPDFLRQCNREAIAETGRVQQETRRWNASQQEAFVSATPGAAALSTPVQVEEKEDFIKHTAVRAIVQEFGKDYSMEQIRKAMEDLHILNGPAKTVSSEQLLNQIWQNEGTANQSSGDDMMF